MFIFHFRCFVPCRLMYFILHRSMGAVIKEATFKLSNEVSEIVSKASYDLIKLSRSKIFYEKCNRVSIIKSRKRNENR